MPKYKAPRGTYDILPGESYKWQYVRALFRQTAKLFNYREIETPIFEDSNIFERTVGDTSDIVEKEMYKFKDKKGRIFALRPEGTASVVRAYIENGLYVKNNASKLFYLGPMFRYDRPQKGRHRQFYQYGIENIGSASSYIDAEVIALADHFLNKLGLENYELQINSIGCVNCAKDHEKALQEYFSSYRDELCADCQKRLDKNPKRILDCKVKSCQKIAADAPSILDYLDYDCAANFQELQNHLQEMGISFKINHRIVRGLDYYTQTAFEFVDNNLGAQNTLIGGGRYDGLIKKLGGKDQPGIGFAGGFERLLLAMKTEKIGFAAEDLPDLYFVNIGAKAQKTGIKILQELRQKDFSVEFDPDRTSISSQMKAANRSGAKFCLILGEDELVKNKVILKDMASGEQHEYTFDSIISEIRNRLSTS